ncbi:MAG: alpha-glucan family phosphorylase [Candidatus Omnitrophota bacterium]
MSDDKLTQFLSLVQVDNYESNYIQDITNDTYFGFPISPIIAAEHKLISGEAKSVAYFSMEYGLAPSIYHPFKKRGGIGELNKFAAHQIFSNMRAIDYFVRLDIEKMLDLPIYSGGLGVLAGDTVKTAADLGISMAAVGILWNKGYFKQNFWFRDGQISMDMYWDPHNYPGLIPLKNIIQLKIKSTTLSLRLWKYYVLSFNKQHAVPVILLDANIAENTDEKRRLTDHLYISDRVNWKILQRVILGMGGIKALEELGYNIGIYHLNEGHAALAYVAKSEGKTEEEKERLKDHFAYTCHTPVAAGHDKFSVRDLEPIFTEYQAELLKNLGMDKSVENMVNLTELAINTSKFINVVSKRHAEVTKVQFPAYANRVIPITNGVHIHTWLSKPFSNLFDRYNEVIGDWKKEPTLLKNVVNLRANKQFRIDLWQAHQENKKRLMHLLRHWHFKENVFTLSWARRLAAYKRPSLILQDPSHLIKLAKNIGPIQIIFAGKAHPHDDIGDTIINEMLDRIDALYSSRNLIRIVILENYDTYFGKLLTSSVDIWLNNPLPPFEASGTSGMKAILNGVIQLSTVDGWVVETAGQDIGWVFGYEYKGGDIGSEHNLRMREDSEALYSRLEEIMTIYYKINNNGKIDDESLWIDKMINAIAAGSYFSTHRMVREYIEHIWDKVK